MDYRKPVTFGDNWSPSRYKVLPYFAHEKPIVTAAERVLDLGCANGWNMSRFRQYGQSTIGLEPNSETLRHATRHGAVVQGDGLRLPFPAGAFDVIYVQHVLHHIGDVPRALAEIRRCLRPGGTLFLIETVEDNPLIRWGRRLHPVWMGDEINAPFRFRQLGAQLTEAGFTVRHAEPYSVLFWLWETLPDQFDAMEKLTPAFVQIELLLRRFLLRWSAHCFYIAERAAG